MPDDPLDISPRAADERHLGANDLAGLVVAEASARKLVELYALLGSLIAAQPTSAGAFAAVTKVALAMVPGAEHASITRGRGDHFETIGATSTLASNADRLQYQLDSGPCIDSAETGSYFRVGDLTTDTRWPIFGPAVSSRFGMASMLANRLVLDLEDPLETADVVDKAGAAPRERDAQSDPRASLNLYSSQLNGFTARSDTIALVLTTHAALAVTAVIERERAFHLRRALVNSRRIGMALGILMGVHQLAAADALSLLRMTSQHANRKLNDIADDVIHNGTIDLPI